MTLEQLEKERVELMQALERNEIALAHARFDSDLALTAKQASIVSNISQRAIQNYISKRLFKLEIIDNQYCITAQSLREYIANNKRAEKQAN